MKFLNSSPLHFWSYWKTVGIHLSLLGLGYILLYFLGEIQLLPTEDNWIQFDAGWYEIIKNDGYARRSDGSNPTAFFPLYPLLWRWSTCGGIGIGLLNALFFYTGLWLLVKNFAIHRLQVLLYLAIPSTLFFYFPYTEATFFLMTSLFLVGFQRENKWFIISGLLLASMTRPSVLFFFPALIFSYLVSQKEWAFIFKWKVAKPLLLGLLAVILGLSLVVYIQYVETDVWFAFWRTQSEQWGNHLQVPELPLRTWTGSRLMWLDGMAFSCAVVALILVLKALVGTFLKTKVTGFQLEKKNSKAYYFAIAYLAIIGLFTLLYHGKDPLGGTTLMGINRYFFATAFFVLLFQRGITFQKNNFFTDKNNWLIISGFGLLMLLILGAFLPSNFPNHLRTILYFIFVAGFLKWQYKKAWQIAFYSIHLVLQIIFLAGYLNGKWLG